MYSYYVTPLGELNNDADIPRQEPEQLAPLASSRQISGQNRLQGCDVCGALCGRLSGRSCHNLCVGRLTSICRDRLRKFERLCIVQVWIGNRSEPQLC